MEHLQWPVIYKTMLLSNSANVSIANCLSKSKKVWNVTNSLDLVLKVTIQPAYSQIMVYALTAGSYDRIKVIKFEDNTGLFPVIHEKDFA